MTEAEGKINWLEIGAGAPLVMLHGWQASLNHLLPLATILSHNYRCILLDLPGFGASDSPSSDWGTAEYAERVLRFLDEIGVETFSLMGHSFGGRVSNRITSTAADRVEKLILIGSHGLTRKRSKLQQFRVKAIPRLGKILKWYDRQRARFLKGSLADGGLFNRWFVPRFGSRDYQKAGALRGTLVKTVIEDQSEALAGIKAPTLCLWGSEDEETPLEMGERFAQLIPNAELIVIDGAGHEPFADVGSHLCARYIDRFLGCKRVGEDSGC